MQGIVVCCFLSLATHAIVIALIPFTETKARIQPVAPIASSVSIRLLPRRKTEEQTSDALKSRQERMPTATKNAGRANHSPSKGAKATSATHTPKKVKPVAEPGIAIRNYEDLFPQRGELPDHPANQPDETAAKSVPMRVYDPENNVPFETKARQLPKLQVFAKELAQQISIPPALLKITRAGTARLRFGRDAAKPWHVSEAQGDQYLRALLFEILNSLSPRDHGLLTLAESEYESVRIVFSFRVLDIVDQTAQPLDIQIDGNQIFLTITRQDVNDNWHALTSSPAGTPAANLLGIAIILAKPYIENDPHKDPDIRRLKASPAFIRPIGR